MNTRDAAASGEPPRSGLGVKGWLAVTTCIVGPLAFGTFAALNETGAAMLSWILSAYDKLTVAAMALSAILWITDRVADGRHIDE